MFHGVLLTQCGSEWSGISGLSADRGIDHDELECHPRIAGGRMVQSFEWLNRQRWNHHWRGQTPTYLSLWRRCSPLFVFKSSFHTNSKLNSCLNVHIDSDSHELRDKYCNQSTYSHGGDTSGNRYPNLFTYAITYSNCHQNCFGNLYIYAY